MPTDDRGPGGSHHLGRRGDVESYAGGAALSRQARRIWPRATSPDGRPAPRTPEDVFRLARRGDPEAVRLVTDATHALATALVAMAAIIEPEAWEACTLFDVNYQPSNMTVAELENGFRDLARRIYDTDFIEERRRKFFARQSELRSQRMTGLDA